MTNEQILNERWKNIDTYLSDYLKNYKNVNQITKDKIQTVFDSIDIAYSDLNKPISKAQKSRLDRFILDLKKKGLLTDYFGYKARLIYNKKSVTYLEMIEIMIMGCYIEQNKNLDEYNNVLFLNTCKDSYEQGIEDISKIKDIKPISFKIPILYTLLNIPILNATAESYLYSLALTNAEELYKQVLINLQLGNKLDVDSRYYKDLFNKQDNRFININGEKLSGGIVNLVENLSNLAYLQAGIDTNTTECRFIAEMDKRTTDMCETLNNQIFKLNEMNAYQRYSDLDKRIVTYHTKGLVQGENLPPINNHFHYCRSTITYNLDPNVADYVRDNIKIANSYDKEQFSRYKKYFGDEIPDNVEEFVRMKYNNPGQWESLKRKYYDKKLQWQIKNEYNLNVNIQKQNKHIIGTKEYEREIAKRPDISILTIDNNKIQEIVNKYAGTGVIQRKDGMFLNKESIILDENIGYVIDLNGNKVNINQAYIYYSKTGTHLVPTLKGVD